jgi:hypothetical protein
MMMTKSRAGTIQPLVSTASIVLASGYAVVVATGLLTIFLIFVARAQGLSVVEYYDHLFPRMRGAPAVSHSLPFGNAILGTYLVVGATIALNTRRRIADRLARRRQRQIN